VSKSINFYDWLVLDVFNRDTIYRNFLIYNSIKLVNDGELDNFSVEATGHKLQEVTAS
jgi:hypothetical protein